MYAVLRFTPEHGVRYAGAYTLNNGRFTPIRFKCLAIVQGTFRSGESHGNQARTKTNREINWEA